MATAPAIEARREETSLAVATITVFGLLAVMIYPLLGRLLGLTDGVFGTWAGTAVNDTSQVVATGLIYSAEARAGWPRWSSSPGVTSSWRR
ncbi:MAG: YeiH family protein [Ignavibacteriales bacterium]|nr:YeiH family protein [Ignavibacteriales bacterium]